MITSKNLFLEVGPHQFQLIIPSDLKVSQLMSSFVPFLIEEQDFSHKEMMFQGTIKYTDDMQNSFLGDKNVTRVTTYFVDNIKYEIFRRSCGGYSFRLFDGTFLSELNLSNDYKSSIAFVPKKSYLTKLIIANYIMMMYAFPAISRNTIMIHSSVISLDGKGYAFLGKSGTGKSTHSKLWLDNIPNTSLLNDDNPIINLNDDKVIIYGTPWSGKTPCYKKESAELRAVVRLSQQSENKIEKIDGLKAYAAFLPSITYMRWDNEMPDKVNDLLSKILSLKSFNVYSLGCLPNAEAAIMCKNCIENEN